MHDLLPQQESVLETYNNLKFTNYSYNLMQIILSKTEIQAS